MSGWTEGSWLVGDVRNGFARDIRSDGGYGGICYGDIRLPDAHLIAAAPDLYAALSHLFDLANHFNVSGVYFTEDECNRDALEAAENALAKARGEGGAM